MKTVMDMMRRHLGQNVRTTDPELDYDWEAELRGRWDAIRDRVLVRPPEEPPTLVEIAAECTMLACVWALVVSGGNLSHAAGRIRGSRRAIRGHLHEWLEAHPTLIPMPVEVFLEWSKHRDGIQQETGRRPPPSQRRRAARRRRPPGTGSMRDVG